MNERICTNFLHGFHYWQNPGLAISQQKLIVSGLKQNGVYAFEIEAVFRLPVSSQ
ncbi:hypothetical protein NAT51_19185 [Flavobacterium amniphilum]|uniref:hypothetical protein n=1 Tax=Flavobacterium amniphilum TaxID=1834035 RepID=UPI00202A87CF|nr:hypothetical protein [Flavobacterium amniphilum]MCL9807655.1 hypothetical protein [Flavobacterium amniphilum]